LFKATHPANTVGCSDRDWLVIYAEGGLSGQPKPAIKGHFKTGH
jgi:hypothetical protein